MTDSALMEAVIAPLVIEPVDPMDLQALALLAEAAREARTLYPELFAPGSPAPTNTPLGEREVYLLAWREGVAVGCGALRRLDGQRTFAASCGACSSHRWLAAKVLAARCWHVWKLMRWRSATAGCCSKPARAKNPPPRCTAPPAGAASRRTATTLVIRRVAASARRCGKRASLRRRKPRLALPGRWRCLLKREAAEPLRGWV
jgi:hypothetical protein